MPDRILHLWHTQSHSCTFHSSLKGLFLLSYVRQSKKYHTRRRDIVETHVQSGGSKLVPQILHALVNVQDRFQRGKVAPTWVAQSIGSVASNPKQKQGIQKRDSLQ